MALLPQTQRQKIEAKLETKIKATLFTKEFLNDYDVIFLDSGTSALFVVFKALGDGGVVYVNPNTCPSVGAAILHAQKTPSFLETSADGTTDLDHLPSSAVSAAGDILLLTNTYGIIEDVHAAQKIAQERGWMVINDLAQANICADSFMHTCAQCDVNIISFGPEKYIAGLGGGAIVARKALTQNIRKVVQVVQGENHKELGDALKTIIARCRYYLSFHLIGMPFYPFFARHNLLLPISPAKYVSTERIPVVSVRPPNVIIMSGILRRILWLRKRQPYERKLWAKLSKNVRSGIVPSLRLPQDDVPPFLVVQTPEGSRKNIARALADQGFQTTWNYIPLYFLKEFEKYPRSTPSDYWKSLLEIPFRFLDRSKVMLLAGSLNNSFSNNSPISVPSISDPRRFFDTARWAEAVDAVFSLRSEFLTCHLGTEKTQIHAESDENNLFANFIGYGGPLGLDSLESKNLDQAITNLEEETGKRMARMKLYPFVHFSGKVSERWHEAQTSILNLWHSPALPKETRYEVRKAVRSGVRTAILGDQNIDAFYAIYQKTAERVKSSYLTPKELFQKIISLEGCFIIGAFAGNKMVAGSVFLGSGDWAYYWWNASDELGRKLSANYLIMQEGIATLRNRGYLFLDMASSHNDSIKRFKSLWGAADATYWEYVGESDYP